MELLISAVVSLIIQGLKKIYERFVGEEWQDYAVIGTLLVLSFVAAWVYYFMKEVGVWESFYQIVLYASGIYAILIRRFEK